MAVEKYGDLAKGSHELLECSILRTDNLTATLEAVGDWDALSMGEGSLAPGDAVPGIFGAGWAGWRVRTVSIKREPGGLGVLSLSVVRASGASAPYHYTYTVDMQEVQRRLESHPLLQANGAALAEITAWEATDPSLRTRAKDGSLKFYYANAVEDASSGSSTNEDGSLSLTEIETPLARKYCLAKVAGIETYNIYLPVVSRITLYLKDPPGLSSNDNTHKLSGTLADCSVGMIDASFDIKIAGYDSSAGFWFKSKDTWTQNADSTWQRAEEWVFTNDKTHMWIYSGNAGD